VLERSEFQGVLAYSLTHLATTRPVQGVRVRDAAHSTMRTCAGCSARGNGQRGQEQGGVDLSVKSDTLLPLGGDSEKIGRLSRTGPKGLGALVHAQATADQRKPKCDQQVTDRHNDQDQD
jgi:hypothetical protein